MLSVGFFIAALGVVMLSVILLSVVTPPLIKEVSCAK
jgi:hypothetical protein